MGQTVIRNPTPQWINDPSVTDSTMTKVLRMLAQAIGADDPSSQVLGILGTEAKSAGDIGGLVGKLLQSGKKPIKAYHGSPHDFDKFSMEKIGTGEGAQAYGHGLYFAENPKTAQEYRDSLGGVDILVDGVRADKAQGLSPIMQRVLGYMAERGIKPNSPRVILEAGDAYRAVGGDPNGWRAFTQEWNDVTGSRDIAAGKSRGRMYEVNIHADPDTLLDWDKPLSAQSQSVQAALQKAGLQDMGAASSFKVEPTASGKSFKVTQGGYEYGTYRTEAAASKRMQELVASHSDDGARAYQRLGGNVSYPGVGQNAAASEALKRAGIPGIKYLDQGSRTAGEGTRNYVIWDDATIEILRKYGLLPGAIGATAAPSLFGQQEQ
jgi:hypothetical protein